MAPRVLVTGSRASSALHLCRLFASAGAEVHACDSISVTLCHMSQSVTKHHVISALRYETEVAIDQLVELCEREEIDLVVPTFEETIFLGQYRDRFPADTRVLVGDLETTLKLHNKFDFIRLLEEMDLPHPKTEVLSPDQKTLASDAPVVLKAEFSRASQAVHFVSKPHLGLPNLEHDPVNPWLAQEMLVGDRYCTYSYVEAGRLLGHVTYPVKVAIGDKSCIYYQAVDHPEILSWVKDFCARINFTGQIGFDFFETTRGVIPIECNPRATYGVLLFKPEDGLAEAMLDPASAERLITPGVPRAVQLGSAMATYGWREAKMSTGEFLRMLIRTDDALFRWRDPLPFFTLFLYPLVFSGTMRRKSIPLTSAFNDDMEWNPGGG